MEFGARRNRSVQLHTFDLVGRSRSLTEVGRRLDRVPPNVSHHVRTLSEELGVALLADEGREARLSAHGRDLHEAVSHALDELRRLPDAVDREATGVDLGGRVRIGSDPGASTRVLPRLVRGFRERYPKVGFELHGLDVNEAVKHLWSRELDLVLDVANANALPNSVERVSVRTCDTVLLTPRDHPLGTHASVEDVREVFRYPLVVPPWGTNARRGIERIAKELGAEVNAAVETAPWETIRRYVERGAGCALIPDLYLSEEAHARSIALPGPLRGPALVPVLAPARRRVLRSRPAVHAFRQGRRVSQSNTRASRCASDLRHALPGGRPASVRNAGSNAKTRSAVRSASA